MEPTMPASAQPADRRVSPQRGAFAIATGGIARGDAILVSADDGLMLCQVIVSPEGSLMLRPAANQLAVLP
jgi:hypothetical protein